MKSEETILRTADGPFRNGGMARELSVKSDVSFFGGALRAGTARGPKLPPEAEGGDPEGETVVNILFQKSNWSLGD